MNRLFEVCFAFDETIFLVSTVKYFVPCEDIKTSLVSLLQGPISSQTLQFCKGIRADVFNHPLNCHK